MAASLEDLLILLNKWKTRGNDLGMTLVQDGQTNLAIQVSAATISVEKADEQEVVFSFGTGLVKGSLTIPLLKGIVFWEIVDSSDPPFFESYDTNFESCVKFTWLARGRDKCVVCALPKTTGSVVST